MHLNRRQLVSGAIAAAAVQPAFAARSTTYPVKPRTGPSMDDLARAAATPVLRRDHLKDAIIIQSMELLRMDKEYFVRVRSTDGRVRCCLKCHKTSCALLHG